MITEMYHQKSSGNYIFSDGFRQNWICFTRSDSINVNKRFYGDPFSLLCASNTNMEVVEPTLVTLLDNRVLLFFVRFIIRNFSLKCKCSVFRYIHFFYCVIFNKKTFLGRVLLISLFGHVTQSLCEEVCMWNLRKNSCS